MPLQGITRNDYAGLRERLRFATVDGTECSPDAKGTAPAGLLVPRIWQTQTVNDIESAWFRLTTDRIGNKLNRTIGNAHIHTAGVIAGGGI